MSSADGAKAKAEEARRNLEDLKLTPEEVNKFETAFKDPEFMKMFAEYAAEISDPKNKAESDMYLRQLEYENKVESVYGKGVQLVIPNPGFAAKTTDKTKGEKVFVNVCHTDKCEDATSVKMAGGLQWSVPHTLGQPHDEKDKTGKPCVAYDFCVSTHTYELTQRDERLKRMVVETAIEAVNRAYKTDLDMNFTLPKKKFMGEKPGVQAIRATNEDGKAAPVAAGEGTTAQGGRFRPMGAPEGAPVGKKEPEGPGSSFSFDRAVKRPAKAKPAAEPEGECEPRYEIIHREGAADLSKTFGNSSASTSMESRRDNRPKALVVRVMTPKIDGIAGAELDVSDTKLFFCVEGKYRLDLELPYEVFGDEGSAKFDKSMKRLEVTLPVKPAALPPVTPFTEPVQEEEEEEEVDGFAKVESPGPTKAAAAQGLEKKEKADNVEKGATGGEEDDGYVMVDKAEARAAASAAAAVAAAKAFEEQGETENQRLWREMCERQAAEQAAKAKAPEPNPAPTTTAAEVGDEGGTSDDEEEERLPAAAAPTVAQTFTPAQPPATYIRPSLNSSTLDDELD